MRVFSWLDAILLTLCGVAFGACVGFDVVAGIAGRQGALAVQEVAGWWGTGGKVAFLLLAVAFWLAYRWQAGRREAEDRPRYG